MNVKQTGYRKGSLLKSKQIMFRVSEKDFKFIQKLAEKVTGGNMSDLIRLALINFKIDKSK